MTVGTVTPIMNALRPGAGNVCNDSVSSPVPVDALEVSINGTSAVTLTVSATAPTSSFKSSVTNCWVPMRMPVWSKALKPASEACRRYDPGSSAAKLYSPLSFVTVVRDRLVASFVSVNSTPGRRAPLASPTDPRRPPWKPCPNKLIATAGNRPNRTKQNVPRNFIVYLHPYKGKVGLVGGFYRKLSTL